MDQSNINLQELTSEQTEFRREIGVFGGVSIIGGIMIGSGIFYLGSYVLMRTGMSQGLALLCWIVGGIVSLLGGLCYAELGAAFPKAGGATVYLNAAYHPIVGFLSGFSSWLIGGPGSIAAVCIALPTALKPLLGLSDFGVKLFAIGLILALTAYNYFGVKGGSILQNVSMVAKLVPIGIILFSALIMGREPVDLSLVPTTGPVGFGKLLGMIAFATVATLWAYEGWTNLNSVTEEVKNPRRDLPLALIIAIGGITVLYALFNFAIYRVLPMSDITALIESGEYYLGTEVAKRLLGGAGAAIVTTGMVISMFGCINGMILAFPRVYYAMAKEGHFFPSFANLHPQYKVPHVAMLAQAGISIVLVLMRNLDQLTSLVVFTGMLYNFLTILAVMIFRRKFPSIERPYKVWGYPFTLIVTLLLFLGLVVNTFNDDPTSAWMGMGVQLIGLVVYFIFDRRLKKA